MLILIMACIIFVNLERYINLFLFIKRSVIDTKSIAKTFKVNDTKK
jgi:hypothetical protein